MKILIQKLSNDWNYFLAVRFESEMTCVIQTDVRGRNIPLPGFSSGREEKWIVLAPYCE